MLAVWTRHDGCVLLKSEREGSVKLEALILSFLLRAIEVGIRAPKLGDPPRVEGTPVNFTCSCDCHCNHWVITSTAHLTGVCLGSIVGLAVSHLVFHRSNGQSPCSPRRRGLGTVYDPARDDPSSVLLRRHRVAWTTQTQAQLQLGGLSRQTLMCILSP